MMRTYLEFKDAVRDFEYNHIEDKNINFHIDKLAKIVMNVAVMDLPKCTNLNEFYYVDVNFNNKTFDGSLVFYSKMIRIKDAADYKIPQPVILDIVNKIQKDKCPYNYLLIVDVDPRYYFIRSINNFDHTPEIYSETIHRKILNPEIVTCSCGCNTVKVRHCSRCKKVYYCNSECQNKDWPEHKKVCKKHRRTR